MEIRGGIDHRGAGEYVVARTPTQSLHHDVHVLWPVRADVEYAVPIPALECGAERCVIGAVADQARNADGQGRLGLAAIENRDAVSSAGQLVMISPS